MRRLLLATTVLTLGGQVYAADLPVRMPVKAIAAAPYSWTTCYIGGHVGIGRSRTTWSDPGFDNGIVVFTNIAPPGETIRTGNTGFLGGAQIGCDYQFANNWVIGLAGDFSWANIEGQTNDPFFGGKGGGPITLRAKTESLATATGRLGYAWDRWMIYGKGGVAWARDRYSVDNLIGVNGALCFAGAFVSCNPSGSTTRVGWTAGLGAEWAFADNWSVMVEVNYLDFGSKRVTLNDPAVIAGTIALDIDQRITTAKIGVNYRFNGLFR